MAKQKAQFWLVKSEPEVFSIDDLKKRKVASWEGVRNYQARNNLKLMKLGELVLFYHSSTEPPGIAGLARVGKEASPDHFAFDRKSALYDPKSDPEKPRWFMVELEFVERFPAILSLERLKSDAKLAGMVVTQPGSRLSVQPVEKAHFERACRLARGLKT
jgi:predicted RNA-binding protein with PUA-like domain